MTKIQTIDVHELKKRCDNDSELCLIDVRELHEWQAIHIPNALHIPKDELTAQIEKIAPDRQQPIYLHCRSGVRSLEAAHRLVEMGYTEVYSIEGGIMDWSMLGYPVEK